MKIIPNTLRNEKGMVSVIAIIVLIGLTIIGIYAITNTNIELQITRNDRISKTAFFAAEASKGYVASNVVLYGNEASDGTVRNFPLSADDDGTGWFSINARQKFRGTVQYVSSVATSIIPRGTGYEYGQYRAHRYQMLADGEGPDSSIVRIDHGFFRIGL